VGLGHLRRLARRLRAALGARWASRRGASKQARYGAGYFTGAEERQAGVSGYGSYTRETSNADVVSYLLWRFLPFSRSLDVGCAKGFVVEGLVELGYDAYGWDVSRWAVADADPAVRPRLAVVDLERRQRRWGRRGRTRYDLVTALEVLEHLDPARVPTVLRRLRRRCDGYVVATIPSLGTNVNGPDGFPAGKVRPERQEHYEALGDGYDGPVPFDDLARDDAGEPVEGHLTIASYSWWTAQFERAGFVRQGDVERAVHPVIGRMGLADRWCFYVFHVDDRDPAPLVHRPERELAELERRWHLTERDPGTASRAITRATVGEAAAEAIERELAESLRRRPLAD
jgi:SAM-dependent methyltransferase